MRKKGKIVMINCICGSESTGDIIEEIYTSLKHKYNFYIVAEYDGRNIQDNYRAYITVPRWILRFYNYIARKTGLYFFWGFIPTQRLLEYLRHIKPDIIHIHCPNSGTVRIKSILNFAAKENIPVIITNHCEVFYTAGCWHADKCRAFSRGCGRCPIKKQQKLPDFTHQEWVGLRRSYIRVRDLTMIAVSPWQLLRIQKSRLFNKVHVKLICNGIDDRIFYKKKQNERILDKNRLLILHVTSFFTDDIDDSKGGYYLIEFAKKHLDIKFIVAGRCAKSFKDRLPENIEFKGYVDNKEYLADLYNMADLTVLTSKYETFGMVCAESLCCGTPVVGFKCGGTESIADGRYSEFCKFGDIARLEQLVDKWIFYKRTNQDFSLSEQELYGKKEMIQLYDQEYEAVLKRRNKRRRDNE